MGAGEEAHGVARGGGVEDYQVRRVRPLQLLDLAQHEDVADAGSRRRHHVEGTGGDQPLGDALEAVVGEVLEQGVVGRERAGPHVGAIPLCERDVVRGAEFRQQKPAFGLKNGHGLGREPVAGHAPAEFRRREDLVWQAIHLA